MKRFFEGLGETWLLRLTVLVLGILALLASGAFLRAFVQVSQWQYLVLAGLSELTPALQSSYLADRQCDYSC
jgi:hypothetical protein